MAGSYLMPGLAYQAKTNRIRSDLSAVPSDDDRSLKVTTYGVQLATNVPTLKIKVPGLASSPEVVIQPIYRLDYPGRGLGGGALVDLKVVSQEVVGSTVRGKVYVNWEDSEQGGDYDQDVWGIIEYELDAAANTVRVTTDVIAESTNQPQGFGYAISGTTKDGAHFHSGIGDTSTTGFNFTDRRRHRLQQLPAQRSAGQRDLHARLQRRQGARGSLFYAAKYGGFIETGSGNQIPDLTSEWTFVTRTLPVSDGIPDNYFFVANPLALERRSTARSSRSWRRRRPRRWRPTRPRCRPARGSTRPGSTRTTGAASCCRTRSTSTATSRRRRTGIPVR